MKDHGAYVAWLDRKPKYPDIPGQTWVRILPPELGGGFLRGKVLWTDGSDKSYAVTIPYGEDGALIYVHKADVEPCDEPSPTSKEPAMNEPSNPARYVDWVVETARRKYWG